MKPIIPHDYHRTHYLAHRIEPRRQRQQAHIKAMRIAWTYGATL